MKLFSVIFILLLTSQSHGFEKESSFQDLSEALSSSNREHNENMKEQHLEEFEKMSEWNERNVSSLKVESEIPGEKLNAQYLYEEEEDEDVVGREMSQPIPREISMND